jgi:chromosomal replication initiator protein
MKLLDFNSIWKNVLLDINKQVGRNNFDRLFTHTELRFISEKEFNIIVPNQFLGDMIRDQYYTLILGSLEKAVGISGIKILFSIDETTYSEQGNITEESGLDKSKKKRGGLNPKYNFSSFVVGAGNQFAYAASRKVAESPGTAYNPLFIYGDVGLGKTHLLSAIGDYFNTHNPNLKMIYITCEQFTNDMIGSIRNQKMAEFQKRYRNVDMLLIDDIQFIAGKERTQEEFHHTFNTLIEDKKQVVFSSDRPVQEISDVEERLRSRFKMGLVADIQSPDLETKVAILYKKAEAENIVLPKDVALFIAGNIRSNVREMEGALIRLGAYSSLIQEKITLEFSRRVLRDTIIEIKKEISIEDVQKAVAEQFQMKVSDLKSKRRTKNLVFPRQIAMFLCRELTKASFPETGEAFGGKDHSTVIHSCKQIEKEKNKDIQLKRTLETLTKKLIGE